MRPSHPTPPHSIQNTHVRRSDLPSHTCTRGQTQLSGQISFAFLRDGHTPWRPPVLDQVVGGMVPPAHWAFEPDLVQREELLDAVDAQKVRAGQLGGAHFAVLCLKHGRAPAICR